MKKKIQSKKKSTHVAKSILRLPDLEVAKNAVINSLSCRDAQRGYRHAIDEFVEWYCSEPRDFGILKWPSLAFCFGPPQTDERVL